MFMLLLDIKDISDRKSSTHILNYQYLNINRHQFVLGKFGGGEGFYNIDILIFKKEHD